MEHRFENLPLVLISGQARSGTTVLTHAIGAHPSICSNLKESSIVDDCASMLRHNLEHPGRRADLSVAPTQLTLNTRRFLLHSLFPLESELGQESVPNKWPMDGQSTPLAISTFSSLRLENLDYVAKIFPNLVIANIYRNGIEVVSSRMTHSTIGRNFSFEQHCVAWSHARDAIGWGAGKHCFVPIPHQELLHRKSTTAIFQTILEKIGITQDIEACTDFVHSQIINVNNSPAVDRHSQKTAEVLSKRIERWRTWDENQRSLFEKLCGESMQFLGYKMPWSEHEKDRMAS